MTAVGYAGGITPNPTYPETCTGLTGHAEVVLVVFDPNVVSYADLLKIFWEAHDPTQGMRQGNDVGTTYRSAVYTVGDEQARQAAASRDAYQASLRLAGRGTSPPKSRLRPPSTLPRKSTSNTWRRTLRLLQPQGHRRGLRVPRPEASARHDARPVRQRRASFARDGFAASFSRRSKFRVNFVFGRARLPHERGVEALAMCRDAPGSRFVQGIH